MRLAELLEMWRKQRVDYPSPDQALVQTVVEAALRRLIQEMHFEVDQEMVGAGFGEETILKNEAKRIYKFENGEELTIVKPVSMTYVKSGHAIVDANGDTTTIITDHSDVGRKNLLYYRIIREKK